MRVLAMTDENGARLNYDGDINNVDVATKAQVLAEIESLLNEGHANLGSAGDAFHSRYPVVLMDLIHLEPSNISTVV